MGLISGFLGKVFGGGGSTTQVNDQKTTVDNNVTVNSQINFDIDKLADTMSSNSLNEINALRDISIMETNALSINSLNEIEAMNNNSLMQVEALKENTLMNIFFGSKVVEAELTQKQREQKTKEDALKLSALSLQQQIKTDEQMRVYTIIGIVIAVLTFGYNHFYKPKKGGKK